MRWWMWILIVLIALMLLGQYGDGAVVGLLVLGGGVAWLLRQERRLAALEARLQRLEAGTVVDVAADAATPLPVPVPASMQVSAPVSVPAQPEAAIVDAGATNPWPDAERVSLPVDGAPAVPAVAEARPATDDRAASPVRAQAEADEQSLSVTTSLGATAMAWLRGGNTIVRVAVLILFIGVAFLLRYAAERTTVPIELRLAGVALGGVALTALGLRLARTRRGYGLSLQGAGCGVVFLTLFAAYRLYALLPATGAFVLLAAMAALTALLAVWQHAMPLALLGFAGAFLAPVLVSTGSGSHVGLFSYQLGLNLAIAWIATRESWKPLNLLGFVFTFGIATAWGLSAWTPEHFATTEPFLIAHFLLFLALGVQYTRRLIAVDDGDALAGSDAGPATTRPRPAIALVDGSLLFGVPLAAFGLQAAMLRGQPLALAASAAVMAAIYLAVGRWLWRSAGRRVVLLVEALLALGVVFLALVTPLALDARGTGIAWAVQGAGLLWLGLRQQRWWAALFGLLLQAGAALAWWPALQEPLSSSAAAVLTGSVLGLSALVSAWHLRTAAQRLADAGTTPRVAALELAPALPWLSGLLLAAGLVQVWAGAEPMLRSLPGGWTPGVRQTLLSLGLAAVAHAAALRLRWGGLHLGVRALAMLAALLLCVGPWEAFWLRGSAQGLADDYLAGGRAVALLLGLMLAARLIARGDRDPAQPRLAPHAPERIVWGWTMLMHAGLVAYTLAALGIVRHEAWTPAVAVMAPTALALALWRRQAAGRFPLPASVPARLCLMGLYGPWAVLLMLWSLAVNLFSDGGMAPLPYVPLLNPLDLAHGLAGLYAAQLLRGHAAGLARRPMLATLVRSGAAAVAFWWLNSLLVRTLHHWTGSPTWLRGALEVASVQTGLTLLWTVCALALMFIAARRGHRGAWIAGAALLAVTVLKLFVVDLDAVGTLARIVSFLAVGGLMLVIGYVSPLPPARAVAADSGGDGAPR